eukprot:m.77870 g.77870  ORF g.77870 m.77870 type:complete len:209 (+) comp20707_c2_seq1:55-681(+)
MASRREMEMQADRITDDSLASTRNIVRLVDETQDIGATTMEELDKQGEQLRRINQAQDKINSDLKNAEGQLTRMERCCGLCVCPWSKRPNFEATQKYASVWKTVDSDDDDDVVATQPEGSKRNAKARKGKKDEDMIDRYLENDAREDEMNENLKYASKGIANIRQMALGINDELDDQDKTIESINTKMSSNNDRIHTANVRTKALLKS